MLSAFSLSIPACPSKHPPTRVPSSCRRPYALCIDNTAQSTKRRTSTSISSSPLSVAAGGCWGTGAALGALGGVVDAGADGGVGMGEGMLTVVETAVNFTSRSTDTLRCSAQ